jgi:hypothetical protein
LGAALRPKRLDAASHHRIEGLFFRGRIGSFQLCLLLDPLGTVSGDSGLRRLRFVGSTVD